VCSPGNADLAPTIRPARPRDAATLVVYRECSGGTEVLMGRRAARHRFMPDYYVFPGGRLDASDYRTKPLTPLRAEVHDLLCRSCAKAQAQALAVAAVRETYEETGLALGTVENRSIAPSLEPLDYVLRAITPPASPIRFHARFFAAEARFLKGRLESNGELLDLDWRPIGECLRLPIADVTEYLLRQFEKGKGEAPRGVPLFSFRRGVARVRT
jgi:8-oxo-dGTP pyrophosphatase MutT (NUDIX family)